MKDGVILMYCKDGVLYPVALTNDQNEMLQLSSMMFQPLKVVFDKPQGQAVNLIKQTN
ncbi:hypothetical protein P9149_01950 [Bacillus thuringiensis]|uniref:Uncharacterized protein n=1 Tax=Bacillus thuringiensis HD-771 TaxID=1218175 RepID=A0A9W3JH57_BACTU|nr:hypothetical protein [Bacillus thuringiensis]AFQ20043.1 hypothetical protein BTG_33568 [Bacillus thuringiensis HD-771]MEC3460763.1 hypothetical protein [Bacillus thuringiensis]MEC3514489.1 hypothetical protein [Bacillus thuringiensis]MEC3540193.1 hypothetical protein [Bacillus thuringiensis]